MAVAAAKVSIAGRVQGVWFRASTREQAERHGLCGWVRNMPDGRVEALFEGEREGIEQMVAWCHQGPPLAAVDEVEVSWLEPSGQQGFRVTY